MNLGTLRAVQMPVDIWGFISAPDDGCPFTHAMVNGACLSPAAMGFDATAAEATEPLRTHPPSATANEVGARAMAAWRPADGPYQRYVSGPVERWDGTRWTTAAAPAIVVTPPPPAPPPAGPRLTFQNVTTGSSSTIVAGRDQWRIAITGAQPNAPVAVTATRTGGAASTSAMGTTDSAGNWSLAGSSTAADIGAWSQTWTAGGTVAGTLSFSVVATAPQTTDPPVTPPADDTDPITKTVKDATKKVEDAVKGIPAAWLWGGGAAAAGLFFLNAGRKTRR